MKRILAVYDTDTAYGDRLTSYLNTRTSHPFQMVAFTSRQALVSYLDKRHVDVLLISQNVISEEILRKDIGQIMLLTEGDVLKELSRYPAIYKYQSSDSVIREVVQAYGSQEEISCAVCRSTERIAVYSPLGRCMKTSLSLVLGEMLSREKKTVYCSLDAFSGLSSILGGEGEEDLSDALYFFRQGDLQSKIHSMLRTHHSLDYLASARCPEDLHQVSAGDLNAVLDLMEQSGAYQCSVIDVGGFVTDVAHILECCSRIYMPVKEDTVSLAKLREYERYMLQAGKEEVMLRTEKLKLPYSHCFGGGEVYLDQLVWGEFGDYVRSRLC